MWWSVWVWIPPPHTHPLRQNVLGLSLHRFLLICWLRCCSRVTLRVLHEWRAFPLGFSDPHRAPKSVWLGSGWDLLAGPGWTLVHSKPSWCEVKVRHTSCSKHQVTSLETRWVESKGHTCRPCACATSDKEEVGGRRKMLGFISRYRACIPNFSRIAKVFYTL